MRVTRFAIRGKQCQRKEQEPFQFVHVGRMHRRRELDHSNPTVIMGDSSKYGSGRSSSLLLRVLTCLRSVRIMPIIKVIVGMFLAVVGLTLFALFLNILYLTREYLTFGNPCKIASEVRAKLASSPRKGLTKKLDPLPKIIHQQWKTEEIPKGIFTQVRDEWKKLYPEPEYTHMLWTDTSMRQLIQERYEWFLDTYDSYPTNIQRADSSRYFILYTYGGLYADLDYEPFVNFWSDLPTDRVSFVESPYVENENVQNSLMSSPPGDPFWNGAFQVLQERRNEKDILFSTGPVAMDESIRRAQDPSWVHVLQCKNFHRIPYDTAEEGRTFNVRLHQRLRRYSPYVRTCGDASRRDDCQFGIHHNAVSYSADLKKLQESQK